MFSKFIERARMRVAGPEIIPVDDLQEIAGGDADSKQTARLGLRILGAGFVLFLLWAFFAPLDEGVPASGTVMVESKRKVVQHASGGKITKIFVREAQLVKAGEPLIGLDDTTAKANFDSARQEYFALQAQTDRLGAEIKRASRFEFSAALREANDAVATDNMNRQQQLFETRRRALQGELAILALQAAGAREHINELNAQIHGKQEQLQFAQEQLGGSRELAKEGYLPRNRWFEEERQASDLQASVNALKASILNARNMVLEAQQRLEQRQRDFQKEVETDFAATQRNALQAAERYRVAKEEYEGRVIRAPVDGAVNGLTALTEGSVVAAGARMMDIVPKDDTLILEVKITPNVIDQVHRGLSVNISVQAFAADPRLVLDGVLDSVSPDLVQDPNPSLPPYYQGRVRVTPEGMRMLGSRVLQPGMQGQVVIRTGERTLVQYLLKPLMIRFSAAMKEA